MTTMTHARTTPRVEDDALVRGLGEFTDDPRLPRQVYAAFARSPHAHARIKLVNTDAARAQKGVLAVFTAKDMKDAGVTTLSRHPPIPGRGGAKMVIPFRPALAGEKVLHVGEPVAMVVAETRLLAQDAAELVEVSYEELPAVADLDNAIAAKTQLHAEAPGNLVVDWPGPVETPNNEREVAEIFAKAAHVAKVRVVHQRLVGASMETRGATGSFDKASNSFTLYACSQGAEALRGAMAQTMAVPNDKMRVITRDVGGAFGLKTPPYPEYPALLVAAKQLGRPVHWASTRSEAFVSDQQGRDAVTEAELALDDKGKFLALRMRHHANVGAYIGTAGAGGQTMTFARCLPAMYLIPKIDLQTRCYFSNTLPIGPYRGNGRPEANYALERLVEEAARVSGIDKVKLRKLNLIPPSKIPYKTAVDTVYDSGDFPAILDEALTLADYAGFARRKREAQKRGTYRGFGVSCMLEIAGGAPIEGASISFDGDKIILGCNVQSTGQGHATVFPNILADKLGIKSEQIIHRHGDTAMGITGFASVGSRSAMCAGHAILHVADLVIEKGKKVASHALEASETDIQYHDGAFAVAGTDRKLSLFDIANRAKISSGKNGLPVSLDTKDKAETPSTYPNGCHIAEVEIDPQTGLIAIVNYVAVDDPGNALDHTIVSGQVHGGIAQGIGQALLEQAVYDSESGQLVTGSFMDYGMPHADTMPVKLNDVVHSVPATTNPLGVKGTGEAGATGSIAAVMNAIADAIPNGAANHMQMPATTLKIWEACQRAMKQ